MTTKKEAHDIKNAISFTLLEYGFSVADAVQQAERIHTGYVCGHAYAVKLWNRYKKEIEAAK